MDRAKKQNIVDSLSDTFSNNDPCIVISHSGLTVAEMEQFRSVLRGINGKLRVTKSNLVNVAIKNSEAECLSQFFSGPTAIVVASDRISLSKIVIDFAKNNKKVSVLAGFFECKLAEASKIEMLANLPTIDEARGQIIGMLRHNAIRVMSMINGPAKSLLHLLNNRK